MAKSEPDSSRLPTIVRYASGGTTSSLSTKVTYSLDGETFARPVLRAAPSPAFSFRTSRNRPSRAAYSAAMAAEPSGEPSSTMTISRSFMLCPANESRQAGRYCSTS